MFALQIKQAKLCHYYQNKHQPAFQNKECRDIPTDLIIQAAHQLASYKKVEKIIYILFKILLYSIYN